MALRGSMLGMCRFSRRVHRAARGSSVLCVGVTARDDRCHRKAQQKCESQPDKPAPAGTSTKQTGKQGRGGHRECVE